MISGNYLHCWFITQILGAKLRKEVQLVKPNKLAKDGKSKGEEK